LATNKILTIDPSTNTIPNPSPNPSRPTWSWLENCKRHMFVPCFDLLWRLVYL